MNNIKKIIIFLTLIIFIIIVLLTIILFTQKKDKNSLETTSNVNYNNIEISLVKDESEYHDIKRIFNTYSNYINYLDYNYFSVQMNDNEKLKFKQEYLNKGKAVLEDILYTSCTQKTDWNAKLLKYAGKKISINEMYKCYYNNINIYYLNIMYEEQEDYIIILIDNNNETFSILPSDFVDVDINKNNFNEIINNLEIDVINKNDNNIFKKIDLSEEQICLQYYYDYLDMLRNDIDKLYYKLDENYRNSKFGSIENFKEYINNNKEVLLKAVLSKYQIDKKDDYKAYIFLDEVGRYYIFYSTAAMKYSLYLDTYTVDLPQFVEKYNNANGQEKMVLNIEKIFSAINNKDYKYVYSKLADSFKNNNFNNEDTLKDYLQKNLYENNEIEYDTFEREGSLYTCKIRVIKRYLEGEEVPDGKNAPSKYLNIVMKLNEGTDFEMSFSEAE